MTGNFRARWCRALALIFCGLLAASLLAACTSSSGNSNPPGSPGASPARVIHDLTSKPFFQTPDGNITCGLPNFHWPGVPAQSGASSQIVICRIKQHTIPPAQADCTGQAEAAPGVFMLPSKYASFTCLEEGNEMPMVDVIGSDGQLKGARAPYHARNGEEINLGPASCVVATSSVDCTSASRHTFHLDPDSFRSPLIPGDSVLAAQADGTTSYIMASSGVARPSTFQWGSDVAYKQITWTQWNSTQAVGTGTFTVNMCTPNCAASDYRTDKDVTVTLSAPMIVCGGWFFTKLTVADPAYSGANGTTIIQPQSDGDGPNPLCLPPSNG